MLSDDPWSLVESFPRRQGLSVPSRLDSQPPRPQGPTVTRSIGTNSPISLDPSVPCPVATKGPMTPETMSPWGFHHLVSLVPVDLGTLSHRVEMFLAILVHRRIGRQVPWLTSRLGIMIPRRIGFLDAWRPGSLGTSTIELFARYWDRGHAGPSVPSRCGQHGSNALRGTWAPGIAATLVADVPRSHWNQGARTSSDRGTGHDDAPQQASRRRQLGTFMSSATLVPRLDGTLVVPGPKVIAAPISRRPHGPDTDDIPRRP
jgi:hypothetical protein